MGILLRFTCHVETPPHPTTPPVLPEARSEGTTAQIGILYAPHTQTVHKIIQIQPTFKNDYICFFLFFF